MFATATIVATLMVLIAGNTEVERIEQDVDQARVDVLEVTIRDDRVGIRSIDLPTGGVNTDMELTADTEVEMLNLGPIEVHQVV